MTFEEKLNAYLREQGYPSLISLREDEELDDKIARLRAKMDSAQREEAMRIVDEFFEDGEEAKFSDVLFPVLKIARDISVRRLTTKKLATVSLLAEDVITQRFADMKIGEEFNVNVAYLGTYDADILVPANYGGENAMDHYRVTIELELY